MISCFINHLADTWQNTGIENQATSMTPHHESLLL